MDLKNIVALNTIISFIVSFIFSSVIIRLLIYIQKRQKNGQVISEYLFTSHQDKKSTPTLGGIAIVIGTLLSTLFYIKSYQNLLFRIVIFVFISFFLIGFIDDFIKVKLKNYKGLSSIIRLLLEILVSLIVYNILNQYYDFDYIQLTANIKIFIGSLGILMFIFILVGSANSVNLTDGLDGLSSSLYLLAIIPFVIFTLNQKEYDLTYLLVATFGATLGFICFNIHPSKIFMGDSGSLSLGGLLGIISLAIHKELLLLIVGGLFVFETLSVILQVAYFKLTKKRLFLMAPFHHHLELKGKKEYQIVMYFFIIGLVLSFVGIFIEILL